MSPPPLLERATLTRSRAARARASQVRLRRARTSRAAAGALLSLTACSLQDFDALSSESAAPEASAGAAGVGGSGLGGSGGARAGDALGGRGGSRATSGGSGGSLSTPPGGAGGSGTIPRPYAGAGGDASSAGAGRGGSGGTGEIVEAPIEIDAGVTLNLLSDPGFEFGHARWVAFGGSAILDVEAEGRDGSRCISSVNRSQTFEGPARDIEPVVQGGSSYFLEAWVRMSSGRHPVGISIKTSCQGAAETYTPVVTSSAGADDWTRLAGEFIAPTCKLSELRFYLEGPPASVSFYVDDAGLYSSP